MLFDIPSTRHCAAVLTLFLGTLFRLHATINPSVDEFPAATFDDRFSTNWYDSVKQVVPRSYVAKGNFDFQKATNALCRESRHGNVAAKALWGAVLVITSHSPETADAGMQLIRDAAAKGYTPAMMNLGYLYIGGRYVRLDYVDAFNYFKQAADLGIPDAQLQLGGCYAYGLGVAPDPAMAVKYYRLAAEQTNYVAMKSLGYHLMEGIGVEKNEDEARFWSLRAAKEGGNRRAMLNLGALFSKDSTDTNALQAAFKWIKQSAELGDALAADELSHYYLTGWSGVETNVASYRYWRFKAAFLGATDAQYLMGVAYRTGDGVPTDAESSLLWYRKAAAKNHPGALYDLAIHYLQDKTNRASLEMANALMLRAAQMGHREAQFQSARNYWQGNITQDCDAGNQWMAKAADNGWPAAEFALFQMNYNGMRPANECPRYAKDPAEGTKWLRRAAEHRYPPAQSILAVMLIRGMGVEQNNVEAEKMLRDSAEHGYGGSQGDLGFAIFHGDVSSTNLVEAAMWCHLALTHSTDTNVLHRAADNLTRINYRLDSDQEQEAEINARNFQALPPPDLDPRIKDWDKNPNYQREDGQFGH